MRERGGVSGASGTTAAAAPEKSAVREYVEALVWALILAGLIRTFFVQAFKIPSGSMLETLQIGDHILVNKLVYGLRIPEIGTRILPYRQPERGDIVVFRFPGNRDQDYIKRVVGIPGDKIQVVHKKLYVNDQPWETPFAHTTDPEQGGPRDNFGPVTVPPEHVFVMGDNRDHSFDSRFWGFVPQKDIKGKAFVIYWSWDSDNSRVRWSRLGDTVN